MSLPFSSELAAVRGELTRGDSKVATLAGLAGAMAAFLATQVAGAPLGTRVVLGIAAEALIAATVVLLRVLRPALGSTGFCWYATMTDDEFAEHFSEQSEAERTELRILSRICLTKYKHIRRAVDLATAGVVTIGISVAVVVVTS